jgi:hypothetical protein
MVGSAYGAAAVTDLQKRKRNMRIVTIATAVKISDQEIST